MKIQEQSLRNRKLCCPGWIITCNDMVDNRFVNSIIHHIILPATSATCGPFLMNRRGHEPGEGSDNTNWKIYKTLAASWHSPLWLLGLSVGGDTVERNMQKLELDYDSSRCNATSFVLLILRAFTPVSVDVNLTSIRPGFNFSSTIITCKPYELLYICHHGQLEWNWNDILRASQKEKQIADPDEFKTFRNKTSTQRSIMFAHQMVVQPNPRSSQLYRRSSQDPRRGRDIYRIPFRYFFNIFPALVSARRRKQQQLATSREKKGWILIWLRLYVSIIDLGEYRRRVVIDLTRTVTTGSFLDESGKRRCLLQLRFRCRLVTGDLIWGVQEVVSRGTRGVPYYYNPREAKTTQLGGSVINHIKFFFSTCHPMKLPKTQPSKTESLSPFLTSPLCLQAIPPSTSQPPRTWQAGNSVFDQMMKKARRQETASLDDFEMQTNPHAVESL
ncbi:hypothetical protein VP01_5291g2 [Puccinia sorghi]|uniref:Uncharacterized protein n=1 Tax=Puccinia sorghi TaxID=27349 RepID=A0A0L6UKC9_9BASI|nr:hypothetical protein VP01_5291g2 [Puccinia sorghi]